MRGKKFTQDVVEQALALYATCGNIETVSKELNIASNTIWAWIHSDKNKDKFEELRNKKKQEFVSDAWRIIEKANELLERKLDVALNNQVELQELLVRMRNQITATKYNELVKKIKAIEIDNLGSLTTAIGTLYDKQALCNKEATQIVGMKLEDFADEYDDE